MERSTEEAQAGTRTGSRSSWSVEAGVVNEAQVSEPVHEKADPGAGRADHFRITARPLDAHYPYSRYSRIVLLTSYSN